VATLPDKIDVNAASEEELAEVLEIDEAVADRIVAHRADAGGIRSVDELAGLAGVDAAVLRRMREKLIVEVPLGTDASPTG
jgi:DNA uptake protein ComE-like DNA-binding protein